MGWDFTIDSDIQLDMAKALKENADELDTQFDNLYNQIGSNNLGMHWVGSDYDAFYTGCEGYKVALKDLTDSIRMYASHFEKVAEGTENLSSTCVSIVQNMTTRGTATVGQNGTVTQGNNTQNGTNNNGGTTNNNGGTTNNNGGTTNNNGGTTNNNGGTTNNNGGTTNNNGGTTNNNGGTTNNNQGNSNGNNSGQSNVTGVWKSYQDAADAGYSNIKTAHEFARGGYDKEKYGTYETYLAAMQERYVGSTYEQDTRSRYDSGSVGNISTVYGPAPDPNIGYSSGSSGSYSKGTAEEISTVYGPAPDPKIGYSTRPSDSYETETIEHISTVYGAPTIRPEIIKPDKEISTNPISTVYGAPIKDIDTIETYRI